MQIREKEIKQRNKAENGQSPPRLDNIAQLPTDTLKTLSKRARSKYYTQKIVAPLLYIESPLNKGYSRAFHCGGVLEQIGKKIVSRYCNSRICHVCNRMRTAKMMFGYIEPLRNLGDLYFTTLTLPNVKADLLEPTVSKMLKDMTNIIRVLRERKKINISGIRKIEVTYNAKRDDYHPHFHLLHSQDVGDLIIDEWLKRNPTAKKKGWDRRKKEMVDIQVTKPVTKKNDDDKKFLNELFKYASKFVVKDEKESGVLNVYVPALDIILRALHKKRSIQSFGEIKKIAIEENTELIAQEIEDIEPTDYRRFVWKGIDGLYDWIDENSNRLTNYQPPDIEFKYFIGDTMPLTKKEKNRIYKEAKTNRLNTIRNEKL